MIVAIWVAYYTGHAVFIMYSSPMYFTIFFFLRKEDYIKLITQYIPGILHKTLGRTDKYKDQSASSSKLLVVGEEH
jgi:hypothetical protein